MKYINLEQKPSGAYYEPQSTYAAGLVPFPDEFLDAFYSAGGFVTLSLSRGVVSGVEPDVEAWEAWQAENPEPEPEPGLEPSGDYVQYGELAEAIREGVNSVE